MATPSIAVFPLVIMGKAIMVQPVANATVTFSVAFKSVTRDFADNPTGADGKSTPSWDVGGPSKGFEIKVTVKVTFGGETVTTVVRWTPV